jgi:hypothetical protein
MNPSLQMLLGEMGYYLMYSWYIIIIIIIGGIALGFAARAIHLAGIQMCYFTRGVQQQKHEKLNIYKTIAINGLIAYFLVFAGWFGIRIFFLFSRYW